MKRSIYVVDDQAPVVETTTLILRRLNSDWMVTGFQEPLVALAAIKANPPDAVLTDELMPRMQGSQLLEEVRKISPTTIRLIMSGCLALDKLGLITSAHQYIAKPFDPMKLRDLIQRGFAARERITHPGLLSIVSSIRSLPSFPQARQALLAELEDEKSSGTAIARRVGEDPGTSVKVLQLANSALFGPGYVVTSLTDAVNCLGTDLIASIVLAQSVFRHYAALEHGEMDLARIWSHCWETACLAQKLCREKKLPQELTEKSFMAGLLHEVGRFILFDNFPNRFQEACDAARQSKIPLMVSLREIFQASPAQISAYVLELWGLPAAIVKSISCLDNPQEDTEPGVSLTSVLYIADHLASRNFPPDSFSLEEWKMGYLESTGCAGDIAEWEKVSSSPAATA